jgi:hypothetical protein
MANEFQSDPVAEELDRRTDIRKALDDLAADYGDPSFFSVLLKEVESMLNEMSDEQSSPEASYAEKVTATLYSDAAVQIRRAAVREEAARNLFWNPNDGLAASLLGRFNLR